MARVVVDGIKLADEQAQFEGGEFPGANASRLDLDNHYNYMMFNVIIWFSACLRGAAVDWRE